MNIYILKFVAAMTNIFVISYVVAYLPNALSADYMLVLAYTVLGTIVVGFGVEVSIERYATALLVRTSKLHLVLLIAVISLVRTVLLLVINEAINAWYTPLIEPDLITVSFVFSSCFFLTLAATLNGVYMYISSATANVIRGVSRLPIAVLPVTKITLPLLLSIEVAAATIAAGYCLSRFIHYRPDKVRLNTPMRTIINFMAWNWIARLTSNLSALNTVKILVLRSDDSSAVMVAYIIQLAQSVENFSPSKVLAGRYRPALARLYDRGEVKLLRDELAKLAQYNIAISIVIFLGFTLCVTFVFYQFMPEKPANFFLIISTCAAIIFILNAINSLNIVSNVIEESHTIFLSSLVMGLCFIAGVLIYGSNKPDKVLCTLFLSTLIYFPVWFSMSRFKLSKALNTREGPA